MSGVKHWLDRGYWSPGSKITRENESYARWYDTRTYALMEQMGRLAAWQLDDIDPNSPWNHEALRDVVEEIHRQTEDWIAHGFPL